MPHPISSPSMELPLTAPSPHSVTAIGRDGRRTKYTIETRSLSYDIPSTAWSQWLCNGGPSSWSTTPTATILSDVSCEARPGEITAIVGPSGAGKTTLLSILAGMIHPDHVHGQILVNGRDMVPSRFRRVSGYVTQDDSLFPLLTVRESLTYSCRLRLRTSRCDDAVANRVLELMKELGLDHVAESRVGGCSGRGISGGERRRVSIGVELVHDPAVLLLDEPTSGLDSASALQIMKLLQSMATLQGKTVVLTIHQPGFRILELFSRVVLISGGTVRHNGPLALLEQHLKGAGHSIPPHVNVLEYAMDATSSLPSQQHHHLSLASSSPSAAAKEDRAVYANSPAEEVLILGERSFKNILRTNQLFAAKMLQSASAGLGLGSVFMNVGDVQSRLGFFAFTLTFLLSSTTEGLPVFLQERGILMRETTRGAYRVSSYVVASALVFLPFLLAVGLLYAFPVYWMVGLRRELDGFLYFALVIWMVVMMANSFVSCFSALVPNYIMGNSLIAGVMGAFFLFSGYFIQKESIPRYWIFMHYLSLFKYPFEAFLVNQYGAGRGRVECLQKASGVCILDGATFLRQQGVDDSQKWSSLMVMLGFICGYRVLCFGILWYRCSRMRR